MSGLRDILATVSRNALMLGAFAVVAAALLALTHSLTQERIRENERQVLMASLYELVPDAGYEPPLHENTVSVHAPEALGSQDPVTVYRATRDGETVAVVFPVVAPDGYSGSIRLLVGVRPDGSLTGVRVVSHKETPGLGDAIELDKTDWLHQFDDRSIGDPPEEGWAVARDGGRFDQFTGATVTPRAVVKAVRKALLYFDANRQDFLDAPANSPEAGEGPGETDTSADDG